MSKKITLKDAYRILRQFQDWRTGADLRAITDCEFTIKEVTEAIDFILDICGYPEFRKNMANCEECKHWDYDGCVCHLKSCKFEENKAATTSVGSISVGYNATASGQYSTALGYNATARDFFSTALGYSANASGFFSTALGDNATASGDCSTALGNYATASADYSTALGRKATTTETGVTVISAWDDSGEAKTQLYLIGAGSTMSTTYCDGEAGLGFMSKDSSGNILKRGTTKLSSIMTENTNTFNPRGERR